jgi:hypothetical protein
MKIDLQSIDKESFMVHQHFVGEHECFLVQPKNIGATWNKENLIYRSSLWDKDGNPVSLSFKKFFNWDEKPDIFPAPSDLKNAKLMEKLDGSTLIFSRYKGQTVIRTRGTVDARKQANGHEIDYLCEKYKKFIVYLEMLETSNESFVLEWLSPTNRIVLNYGDEPDMVLTAIINHGNYSLMRQSQLDYFASDIGLRRPRTFSYNSVEEMKSAVEVLKDQEGLCVYYGNEQQIRKVKAATYLMLHRLKSEVSNIENVIDAYLSYKDVLCDHYPSYDEFFEYLSKTYDYEIAIMARGHISKIVDAMREVFEIMGAMTQFAKKLESFSRKDQAAKVLQAYGQTNRASYVFAILDKKSFDKDKIKKLLFQVLKK